MVKILESIFKGFAQWLYGLGLEIVQYIANSLLDVFSMDLDYFRRVAPVTDDILSIIIAAGWALLLGNLVFQATKSMVSGLGFEGEDPKLLFTRTFVFGFFLLASRQVCDIGLGISARVIELLQLPTSITVDLPGENCFSIGASWLLIIIVNVIIMWQIVKLFFEIAERYVVTAMLVLLAPLAFATGGSKNTADIFKGWCRMFGSMCLMMVLNVVFLKLLLSAMGSVPSDVGVLPWMLLIVGIARVARKADSIVARMGLNPAITGDGLGRGLPGMVAYAVVKSVGSTVAKTVSHSAGKSGSAGPRRSNGPAPGGRSNPSPAPPPAPPSGGGPGASRTAGNGAGGSAAPTGNNPTGAASGNTGNTGTAKPAPAYAQQGGGKAPAGTNTAPRANQSGQQTASGQQPTQQPVPGSGAKAQRTTPRGARRTSAPPGVKMVWQNTPRPSSGMSAPTAEQAASATNVGSNTAQSRQETPERPPIPRVCQNRVKPSMPSSGGGQPPKGASRRTSTVHTASASTASATHINTQTSAQQVGQPSKPIRQNGTSKISPPPGVGASGKRERGHSDGAGTRKISVSTQPPIGCRASPSGTAGTGKASAANQPPVSGGAPLSGTAGTGKAPAASQPTVSGGVSPSDTAGTRKTSVPTQPPIGGRASPSGTAGTGKAPAASQPTVNGGTATADIAGTRKTSVPTQPPIGGRVAPTGTAGVPQAKPAPAKHTKSSPAHAPMNGGAGHKKNTRRKKGGPDLG